MVPTKCLAVCNIRWHWRGPSIGKAGFFGSLNLSSLTVRYQKTIVKLRYGGAGVGWGPAVPVKHSPLRTAPRRSYPGAVPVRPLPPPKDRGTLGASSEVMPSKGLVFRNESLKRELTFNDFQGPCGYVDFSVGVLIWGKSSTLLVFGIPPAPKALVPLPPDPVGLVIAADLEMWLSQAHGAILFCGDSAVIGVSATESIGYMIPKLEVTQGG